MTAPLARFTGRIGALGFAAWLIAGPHWRRRRRGSSTCLRRQGRSRPSISQMARGACSALPISEAKSCCSISGRPGASHAERRCRRSTACRRTWAVRISRSVPLSIDRGGHDVVAKFYAENGIRNLAIYIDTLTRRRRRLAWWGCRRHSSSIAAGMRSAASSVRPSGTRPGSPMFCRTPSRGLMIRPESCPRSRRPGSGRARCGARGDG